MPNIYYKADQWRCCLHHTSAPMCLCSSKITLQQIPRGKKVTCNRKPVLRKRKKTFCMFTCRKMEIKKIYRFLPFIFCFIPCQPIPYIYLPTQDTPSSANSVPGSQKQMTFWVSGSTRHSSISQWLQLRCSLISTSPCPSVTREWMKEAKLITVKISHIVLLVLFSCGK